MLKNHHPNQTFMLKEIVLIGTETNQNAKYIYVCCICIESGLDNGPHQMKYYE